MIRDSLLDEIKLEDDIVKNCSENFFEKRNINEKDKKEDFLIQNLMDENDLLRVSSTQYKSNLFSLKLFESKTEEYFQKRKIGLNQYVYSLIQIKDQNLAQEIYLSLDSNESEFSTLASKYSLGSEKYKNGIVGPIPLSQLNLKIQNIFKSSEKGIINEPIELNGFWIILRIEEILYAEFNDQMKKLLSNELFEAGVLFGLKDDPWFSEPYGNYFNVHSIDLHGFNSENVSILMDVIGSCCTSLFGKQIISNKIQQLIYLEQNYSINQKNLMRL